MITDSAYNFAFPNMAVPDKEKGEQYHRQFLLAILSNAVYQGNAVDVYFNMEKSMRFYNGDYDISNKFDFLMKDPSGKALPAVWMNFNSIRNKINLLEGEYAAQKVNISCKTINREAASRKMRKRAEILAQKIMMEVAEDIDPEGDLLGDVTPKYVPYTEEELDVYMQSSYKENIEMVMDSILRFEVERDRYTVTRLAMARYMLITSRAIARTEFRDGKPHVRAIDPRYVIVDPYVFSDDMLSQGRYVAEWRYVSLSQAAQDYGLSMDELKEIQAMPSDIYWGGYTDRGREFLMPFSVIGNQNMCLVCYAEWSDIKQVTAKVTKDQYGNEHVKILGDKDRRNLTEKERAAGAKIEKRSIETIRKATLIGGHIVKEWGELDNIVRTSEGMDKAEYTYTVVSPQYVNYRSVSKVEELGTLQELKDLLMYHIQTQVSSAGRKGFEYDLSQKPDTLSLDDVLYYLKVAGVAFKESNNDPSLTGGQIRPIDNSLSDSINLYLNLVSYVDMEMSKVSGINEARQGFQKSDSLVGVSQMQAMQSSLITQPLNSAFANFENILWHKHANYIKTIFPYISYQYEPIISEMGVDIMDADEDIPLQTYGIFVQVNGDDIMNDRNKFEGLINAAVMANSLPIHEAMVLLYNPDTKTGVKQYLAIQERKQQAAMQQQQQQMEGEMAMQQQEAQADTEKQIVVDRERTANKMQQQDQRENLKRETMVLKADIDELREEQRRNFDALMAAMTKDRE